MAKKQGEWKGGVWTPMVNNPEGYSRHKKNLFPSTKTKEAEIIKGAETEYAIHEEKHYMKMDAYELGLNKFKCRQTITDLENMEWRIKRQRARLQQHVGRLETFMDRIFINEGVKVVKELKDEDT